jgi:hypothetical protein
MPYINIDLEEIYNDLTSFERNELISWLEDDGWVDNPDRLEYPTPIGIEDEDVVNSLLNILNNRDSLTNEERELIKKIGERV